MTNYKTGDYSPLKQVVEAIEQVCYIRPQLPANKLKALRDATIGQNGKLEEKVYHASSKQDICDFLNSLARQVEIDRRPGYPQGYLATVASVFGGVQ